MKFSNPILLLSFPFWFSAGVLCPSILEAAPGEPNLFLKTLLNQDLKIKSAVLDLQMAQWEKQAAQGLLDPKVYGGLLIKVDESQPNSRLEREKITEKRRGFSGGLEKAFSFGTSVDVGMQSLKISSDSLNAYAPTYYQNALTVNLEIPLLKGRGEKAFLHEYFKTLFEEKKKTEELKKIVNEEIKEALSQYLDLYEAFCSLKSYQQIQEKTHTTFDSVQQMVKLGKKSQIDWLMAKAEKQAQEVKILKAQEKIRNLSFELEKKGLSTFAFKDLHHSHQIEFLQVLTDDLLEKFAEGSSPPKNLDLSLLDHRLEESQSNLEKLQNDRLPHLTLKLQGISSGLGRTFDQGIQDLPEYKYPTYQVLMEFNFPLGGNSSQAQVHLEQLRFTSLQLEKRKKEIQWRQDQKISEESLAVLTKKLESLKQRVALEEEKLEAKKIIFHLGRIGLTEYLDGVESLENLLLEQVQTTVRFQKERLKHRDQQGFFLESYDPLDQLAPF